MTTVTTPDTAFSFLTVPNLVTCSEVTIEWTYNATAPPTSDYPLVVTNIGVDQSGLDRRGYPLVSRQSTSVVNTTLATVNASAGKFDWSKVNIPQGWYRMNVYATAGVIPSNTFSVTNGLDVSCVVTPSQSAIPPSSSTPASTISPSSANGPSVTTSLVNLSVKRHTAAIAGGVVGGVILFLVILTVALWLVYRRRRSRTRNATPQVPQSLRWKHDPLYSTGAILSGTGNSHCSVQGSTSEKSVAIGNNALTRPPSISASLPPKPQTYNERPRSMVDRSSFQSYDSLQPWPSTSPSNPHDLPSHPRRSSRKPVPLYDPEEFAPFESSNMSPSSETGKTHHFIDVVRPHGC